MTRYRSLDLQNGSVICALMALDAELCEFHYLCAELGPFFKFFFDEFTTDAHRKGLHRERMPGCLAVQDGIPAHVSHYGRDYWKPQIEKKQILAIQELFTKFRVKWHELYSHFNAKFYFPQTVCDIAVDGSEYTIHEPRDQHLCHLFAAYQYTRPISRSL